MHEKTKMAKLMWNFSRGSLNPFLPKIIGLPSLVPGRSLLIYCQFNDATLIFGRYVLKKIRLSKMTEKFKCTANQEVNLCFIFSFCGKDTCHNISILRYYSWFLNLYRDEVYMCNIWSWKLIIEVFDIFNCQSGVVLLFNCYLYSIVMT